MGVAVVFPGQGTQREGMGAPWRDHPAWSVVERAEEISGRPLAHLLLDAPATELSRTREAQLAVFLTSLVAWEAARDRLGEPVAFAGHSLGQVTALVAAGALALDDAVGLVVARAEATQAAADRHPGRLVALLGADLEQAEAACAAAPDRCWVANDNAPGQIVLGGPPDGVDTASNAAREAGVRRVMPLDVGGAFHTPLMDEARAEFERHLEGARFAAPSAPVVHNTDARPHGDDAWEVRLAEHLVRPVRWREGVLALHELGADAFVEVGPGSTLSGMVRRTVRGASTESVAEPDDVPSLAGT